MNTLAAQLLEPSRRTVLEFGHKPDRVRGATTPTRADTHKQQLNKDLLEFLKS